MPDSDARTSDWIDRQIALASICTLAGLVCLLIFLVKGFGAVTMGLGTFVGIPLVALGLVLYLSGVLMDLRRRGAL